MVLEGNTLRNWFCAPAYANRTCSQSRKLRCTQYKADGLQILREQRSPESEGSRSSRRDRAKEAYIMRATNIRKKTSCRSLYQANILSQRQDLQP